MGDEAASGILLNGKIDDEEWERLAGGGRTVFPRCLPPRGRNPIHSRGSCVQTNNGDWGVAFHQMTHDWSVSAGKVRAMS